MKRILAVLTLCSLLLTVAGCSEAVLNEKDLMPSPYEESFSSAIAMKIEESDIKADTEKITLTFENTTDEEFTFGFEQQLEIKLGGKWYAVPLNDNSAWNSMAGILAPKGTSKQIFALSGFYKQIVPGDYRIVKVFNSQSGTQTASVEFTIA